VPISRTGQAPDSYEVARAAERLADRLLVLTRDAAGTGEPAVLDEAAEVLAGLRERL